MSTEMGRDPIAFVLDRFDSMVRGDGARIERLGVDGGVLRLRYVAADGAACDECVLDPDDLEALIGEALERQGADVTSVTVER